MIKAVIIILLITLFFPIVSVAAKPQGGLSTKVRWRVICKRAAAGAPTCIFIGLDVAAGFYADEQDERAYQRWLNCVEKMILESTRELSDEEVFLACSHELEETPFEGYVRRYAYPTGSTRWAVGISTFGLSELLTEGERLAGGIDERRLARQQENLYRQWLLEIERTKTEDLGKLSQLISENEELGRYRRNLLSVIATEREKRAREEAELNQNLREIFSKSEAKRLLEELQQKSSAGQALRRRSTR